MYKNKVENIGLGKLNPQPVKALIIGSRMDANLRR
jgi:hypothetical protein